VRGSSLITPRRLAIVGVSVLSLIVCCGLAWWQWQRYESATGTWQNLGYVLQWPLFGLFPAFLFWRMRKLRDQHRAETSAAPDPEPAPEPAEPPVHRVHDDDDDPVLAEYNRYLRALNARDHQEAP
jgi:DNA-binding transcriptional regulator of glucitol operon